MVSSLKISVYCTNCSRTQGQFDSKDEALLKIAEMDHCKYCNQIFTVNKNNTYGFDWIEITIDNSNTNSGLLKNELEMTTKSGIIPFVSMSFDPADQEINNCVTGILKSLQINYVTGERYSKDSVPDKVKNRIANSGLFIVIFPKRNKLEDDSFTTSAWLIDEMGIAQGCNKDIIAWIEKGISDKEVANLNYKKELIYFDRTSLGDMQKATSKFLEALKEHRLI